MEKETPSVSVTTELPEKEPMDKNSFIGKVLKTITQKREGEKDGGTAQRTDSESNTQDMSVEVAAFHNSITANLIAAAERDNYYTGTFLTRDPEFSFVCTEDGYIEPHLDLGGDNALKNTTSKTDIPTFVKHSGMFLKRVMEIVGSSRYLEEELLPEKFKELRFEIEDYVTSVTGTGENIELDDAAAQRILAEYAVSLHRKDELEAPHKFYLWEDMDPLGTEEDEDEIELYTEYYDAPIETGNIIFASDDGDPVLNGTEPVTPDTMEISLKTFCSCLADALENVVFCDSIFDTDNQDISYYMFSAGFCYFMLMRIPDISYILTGKHTLKFQPTLMCEYLPFREALHDIINEVLECTELSGPEDECDIDIAIDQACLASVLDFAASVTSKKSS